MGQKLNPTIYRLGVNKIWKTEFIEKKNHELPLYIFKDLEIINYMERVFEINGMVVHDYKQHYHASTLNLYISYFVTSNFISNIKVSYNQLTIKNKNRDLCVIQKKAKKAVISSKVLTNKRINCLLFEHSSKVYNIKQYLKFKSYSQLLEQPLFASLGEVQQKKYLTNLSNENKNHLKGFFAQIFEVLNLFWGSHLNFVINFCCINKDVRFYKLTQTPPPLSFQRFRNTPFFKEGIELLFNVVFNSNSANLLAKFVAFQLKKVKRHKFLLSFLKQILNLLLTSNLAKIKGVKILIQGRLSNIARAKHKIILIGDVPAQTVSAKLNYSQTTTHNSNGSYGIKIWIVDR